ncbi:hypothetical protein [Erysipelothrix aquatica]|uniref:hypothetical protein n=1 Tax=Erysipelothrix aquatica TaxID=2683714 RepID=UPI00135B729B|nr:hypothetical protein [Erysipelothrix aquatica]
MTRANNSNYELFDGNFLFKGLLGFESELRREEFIMSTKRFQESWLEEFKNECEFRNALDNLEHSNLIRVLMEDKNSNLLLIKDCGNNDVIILSTTTNEEGKFITQVDEWIHKNTKY